MPDANPYMDLMGGSTPSAPPESAPAGATQSSSPNPYMDLMSGAAKTEAPAAAPQAAATDAGNQPAGYVERSVALTPYKSNTPQLEEDRGDQVQDIPANAMKDLGDFAQGAGAIASTAVDRVRTNFANTMEPFKTGDFSKAFANEGRQTGQDLQTGFDVIDHALQDYHNRYIAPMEKGDIGAIQKQLVHHPVNAFLDLAPFTKGAGEAAKLAPQALEHSATGLANKVAGAAGASKVADAIDTTKQFLKPDLSKVPFVKDVTEKAEAYNGVRDALRNSDASYRKYLGNVVKEIDDTYRQVPNFVKPFLIEGSEGTNKLSMQMVNNLQTVKNFYDKVGEFSDSITERLKESGMLSEEEALMARYGPAYQALLHKMGNPIKAAELPNHLPNLEKFKTRLDKIGAKPGYWGLAQKRSVEDFLKNEAHKPIQTVPKSSQTNFLKARQEARVSEHPGTTENARLKLRNPEVHAEDARDVAVDRILRGARVLHVKEAIDELMANPLYTTRQKGWMAVHMEKLIEGAAKGAGLDQGALTKFMANVQKEIYLPAQTAWYEKFEHMVNNLGAPPTLVTWASSTFKFLTLGPDIFWGATQFAQNGLLYGWFAVKRPQDITNALMAMAISFDKDAKSIVPSSFLLGAKATGKVSKLPERYYLEAGERWTRRAKDLLMMKPITWLIKKNFETVAHLDNYWRIAAAVKFMLDEMGPSVGKGAKLVDRMLSVSVRMDALGQGFSDAAKTEKVLKEVNVIMGDYEKARGSWGAYMSETIMFWPWLEHAWGFTMRVPHDTPLKAAVSMSITQAAAHALQKGEIPSYLKRLGAVPAMNPDGTQAKDENGMPLVMLKPGITPFIQTPDNLRQILGTLMPGLGFAVPEQDMSGMTVHPFLRMAIWIWASVKPGGRKYKDPRMMEYGDGFIKRDTAERMAETGEAPKDSEIVQNPKPNVVSALGMTMMPREWLLAARAYESQIGGVPSDFTIPGVEHAPKRMPHGQKQKPLPMSEYVAGFGRFAPTQTKFSPEDEEGIKASQTKKSIQKFLIGTSEENP